METVLLKIPDVMARLAVGQTKVTKVYELMSTGELQVGRSRRVPNDELERFIAKLDVEFLASPCVHSEEPGMLRSRLVLATFLVVTCAACGEDAAGPAPTCATWPVTA